MRIIIAGCGEMGFHLSKLLAKEEHDIVIIDKDPDVLAQADILDVISIVGSATSYKVLEQANIKSSDLLIAVTESEETNMISCKIGKHLGVKKTIARISNSDFIHRKDAFDLSSVGIDEVIFPEALAAKEIRKLLKESAAITTFDFEGGLLEFIGIPIGKDSALNGKSLKETNYLNPDNNFTPVAILRDVEDVVKNKTIIPRADDIFEASDHAYFVAERDGGVDRVLALSGKKQYDIKDLMIYGGGPMAFVTAKHLAKKYKIKLIEEDRARCEEIAAAIPNIMVLNGSGTEDTLYGNREITFSKNIVIEKDDFKEEANRKFFRLTLGKEVRLKNAYIIKGDKVEKDNNGNIKRIYCTYDPKSRSGSGTPESLRKVKGTIHWVDKNNFQKIFG